MLLFLIELGSWKNLKNFLLVSYSNINDNCDVKFDLDACKSVTNLRKNYFGESIK